jgi:monoamine oxidase
MDQTISQADFAVVGAGLAGLQTAVDLQGVGADVVVFEARDRVGGRVFTATESGGPDGGDLAFDLGGQWVGPGQTLVLRLARQLGLRSVPTLVGDHTTWIINGRRTKGSASLPRIPLLARADLVIAAVRLALMSRMLPPAAPWAGAKGPRWDRLSAGDWLRRHMHTTAGRAVAKILIEANLAVVPDQTSLLGLLFWLRSTTSLRSMAAAEALRLREGTYEMALRLADPVRNTIRFGDPVRAVRQDATGVRVESDSHAVHCRRAAVCVPPGLCRKIEFDPPLPAERADLLQIQQMGHCVKFHAVYPRPFWRDSGSSAMVLSGDDLVGLTYDNSPDPARGPGVLVGFVLADKAKRLSPMDHEEKGQAIRASLGTLFGPEGARPHRLIVHDWMREEWTGGAYAANFAPSSWAKVGGSLNEPFGRVHWGGTETSTEWYGYMEGALRSAQRVVAEMLEADRVEGNRDQ